MKKVKCHHTPPDGDFLIGNTYEYTHIIDAINVYDEKGEKYSFNDIVFLWYFTNPKDSV